MADGASKTSSKQEEERSQVGHLLQGACGCSGPVGVLIFGSNLPTTGSFQDGESKSIEMKEIATYRIPPARTRCPRSPSGSCPWSAPGRCPRFWLRHRRPPGPIRPPTASIPALSLCVCMCVPFPRRRFLRAYCAPLLSVSVRWEQTPEKRNFWNFDSIFADTVSFCSFAVFFGVKKGRSSCRFAFFQWTSPSRKHQLNFYIGTRSRYFFHLQWITHTHTSSCEEKSLENYAHHQPTEPPFFFSPHSEERAIAAARQK